MEHLRSPLRSLAWLGFFAAILAAWVWLYLMAVGMDLDWIGRPGPMGEVMRTMDPRMDMVMPMAEFGPLFAMWAVMMAAMMLPTLVPTLRAYDDLIISANGTRLGWIGVLLGYFAAWVGFAALITAVQLVLLFSGVLDMLGIATSLWVTAGLLAVVGLYQFTWLKDVCHGVCLSPMSVFLSRWRPGFLGGIAMGLWLGVFCVGCCWGFMALGFVGGVMSLLWMGAATLLMILEKLPQVGATLHRPVGVALIAASGAVALRAGGAI